MNDLLGLVQRDNPRIELTLNLAAHSPTMALAFAEAANRALPRGTLAGLAIGNEPDLYRLQPQLETERLASTTRSTPKHWTRHYNVDMYVQDYRSYARAISQHLRGLPLPRTRADVSERRVAAEADRARVTAAGQPAFIDTPPQRATASSAVPSQMPPRFLRTASPAGSPARCRATSGSPRPTNFPCASAK